MKITTDYPDVNFLDSGDSESLRAWVDTLGDQWVRVNLVTDSLGHLVGTSGTSADITGGADRDVLNALRLLADVIVLGGESIRREPDAVPRNTPLVVISKSADIPLGAIQKARGGITVLHGPDATAPTGTTGVVLTRFAGSSIIRAVRALGHRKILVEGGLTVLTKLHGAGLVDEFCVTVSPRLGSMAGPTLPPITGALVSVAHDADGFRYTRRRPDGAPQRR